MAHGNRGAVLLIVMGVLVVLALLGTTFATLQQVERSVSRNFLDRARAKLLARAGISYAAARLTHDAELGLFGPDSPMTYWGDVLDENGAAFPNTAVPVELALNPSYALDARSLTDPNHDPYHANSQEPLVVDTGSGKTGVSMMMESSSYGRHGDFSTLRVSDLQSRLHINDGVHEPAGHRPVTEGLRRMLNTLGALSTVDVERLGDRIIDARPADGYVSLQSLRPRLTSAELDRVRPHLTAHAWVDAQVALPVPLSAAMLDEYPVGDQYYSSLYRRGRGRDYKGAAVSTPLRFAPPAEADGHDVRVWGLDELRPHWIEITKRAPVHINAASPEVLTSVLADLRGFFLMERRRKSGDAAGAGAGYGYARGMYGWMLGYATYSPEKYRYRLWHDIWNEDNYAVDEADDLGRLYASRRIDLPIARAIASEIIACRKGVASPKFDYSQAWFGGPFRSWRQFHAFCDNLVAIDVLSDDRSQFRDYPTQGTDLWGWANVMVPGSVQRKVASRAMADVLKANFNPNLHLNELNPDRNLHLFVDKTDLISQTTEFCFTPMGYFEIESVGRVLRTLGADALTGPNELAARAKATAVIKVFDVLRHTSQKDFYRGTFGSRKGSTRTNNNASVESGPEPDNGPAAGECAFDGYLSLPTTGGTGQGKEKGELLPTPVCSGSDHHASKLHAHFALDDSLNHHIDGKRANLARHTVGGEFNANYPDPGTTEMGPYVPTSGPYRLAQSFRLGAGPLPSLTETTGLDLRIDGMYSERHSGLAYWFSEQVQPRELIKVGGQLAKKGEPPPPPIFSSAQNGAVSFWVKPSFLPELSGKTRQFLDLSLNASSNSWGEARHEWGVYYFAGHDRPPDQAPEFEPPSPLYIGRLSPMSLLAGMNWGGVPTSSLNHETHGHSTPVKSVMRDHQWMHLIVSWKSGPPGIPSYIGWPAFTTKTSIYVNGKLMGDPNLTPLGHSDGLGDVHPPNPDSWWFHHADGSRNTLRLGHVSRYLQDDQVSFVRTNPYQYESCGPGQLNNPNANHMQNWSADATLDELYYWGVEMPTQVSGAVAEAQELWRRGRYYVPGNDDGDFLSPELHLGIPGRSIPPPAPLKTPFGKTVLPTHPPQPDPVRVLGVSWTMYGEADDPDTGLASVIDHDTGTPLTARAEVSLEVNDLPQPTALHDEGFSPLPGCPPLFPEDVVRYRIRFRIPDAHADSILLASPVIDDLTILFSSGPRFVFYACDLE